MDNDRTLPLLAQAAVSLAQAGADMVAPSDMNGWTCCGDSRTALDKAGWEDVPVMSYAVKYASAFAARSGGGRIRPFLWRWKGYPDGLP